MISASSNKNSVKFHNIRLGDGRNEVMYKLGPPEMVIDPPGKGTGWQADPRGYYVDGPPGDQNSMPTQKSEDDYPTWDYTVDRGSSNLLVGFDNKGKVKSVECVSLGSSRDDCGPLVGMRNGDSEARVLTLGKPSVDFISGVTRTIGYEDIGVRFYLSKGRVYSFTMERPTGRQGAIFRRFLRTRGIDISR